MDRSYASLDTVRPQGVTATHKRKRCLVRDGEVDRLRAVSLERRTNAERIVIPENANEGRISAPRSLHPFVLFDEFTHEVVNEKVWQSRGRRRALDVIEREQTSGG